MESEANYNGTVDNKQIIPLERRFHPGTCFLCFSTLSEEKPLLSCGQCKLVSYCSKECQRKDWKEHKPFCKYNKIKDGKNVFAKAKDEAQENGDWIKFRSSLLIVAQINLKRPLTKAEKDILSFPRVCEVCKEVVNSMDMIECEKCHSAFYCCESHQHEDKGHLKWCSELLVNLLCDTLDVHKGLLDLPVPADVDKVYTPLSLNLRQCMHSFREEKNVEMSTESIMVSDRLSYPLSLLFILQSMESYLSLPIEELSELKVHIVGATSSVELVGMIKWEYFMHRLPKLGNVHFVFIGPDLLTVLGEEEELPGKFCLDNTGLLNCSDCKENNRLTTYEMAAVTYDEYAESMHYSQPDLVIAFNCGFHEYNCSPSDLWKTSLDFMTSPGDMPPVIFTSYTQCEAELDLECVMQNREVRLLIPPKLNPFCSLRPQRDMGREAGNQVYYSNQYVTCVKGMK